METDQGEDNKVMNITIQLNRPVPALCVAVLIVLSLVCGLCFGAHYEQETAEPQIIGVPYPYEIKTVTIVEKTTTTAVYFRDEVPVIKYQNIYAREFESREHFEQWYLEQDFNIIYPSCTYKVDCDDYAERVQRVALEQGYSVSQALVNYGQYFGMVVRMDRRPHTANLVLIDDVYYYFEPTPGDFDTIRLTARD